MSPPILRPFSKAPRPPAFAEVGFSFFPIDNRWRIFYFANMNISSQLQKSVGARIREIREDHELTQAELAKLAGTDQCAISEVECGKHAPLVTTVERIASALGVKLRTIFP